MREKLIALRERRAQLLERAAAERERLAALLDRTDAAERWVAAGARAVDEAKRHPLWIAAAVAFLFALRPRRVAGWAMRGWTLYRIYLRGRALLERFAPGIVVALRTS